MTKKIRFSLKVKLIFLISTLLLVAIGIYTLFAVELFQKDKEAYVYESALTSLDQLNTTLGRNYAQLNQQAEMIYRLSSAQNSSELLDQYLTDSDLIAAFGIYELNQEESFHFTKEDFLESMLIDRDEWKETVQERFYEFLTSPPLSPLVTYQSIPTHLNDLLPLGSLIRFFSDSKTIIIITFDLNNIVESLNQQRLFDYVLKDSQNNLIQLVSNYDLPSEDYSYFLATVFSNESQLYHQGVRQLKGPASEQTYLVAFNDSDLLGIQSLAVIPHAQAFSATAYLVRQSFLMAILVLSIAVIIGVLFSKTLTGQLEKLYQATLKIARGDFTTRVETKGYDEIAALGHSFNVMSDQILLYMEEMKEKTRLENELAVAKLVQDSFFPPQNLTLGPLKLASYYAPATECGGDWWGTIEREDNIVVIIADATGHGVPAAFLTATLFSGVQTLDQLTPGSCFKLSSHEVMHFMNSTVCKVGKEILLTAVVLIIDKKSGAVQYTNASHLDPLVLRRPPQETATKQNFIPLMDAKGPRLGHKSDAEFTTGSFVLEENDFLLLWTDGITEAQNKEGKEWGSRKFYQSILNQSSKDSIAIRDQVIFDLKEFSQQESYLDDVTLICAQWSAGEGAHS